MFERTGQYRPWPSHPKVKRGAASHPRAGEDLEKAQVGSLQGIDDRLPHGPTTEGRRSQEDTGLCLSFHVDGIVPGGILLGDVVRTVSEKDADPIAQTGRESKTKCVRGIPQEVPGEDWRWLPSETGGEDFGDGDLSRDFESIQRWWADLRWWNDGRHEAIIHLGHSTSCERHALIGEGSDDGWEQHGRCEVEKDEIPGV